MEIALIWRPPLVYTIVFPLVGVVPLELSFNEYMFGNDVAKLGGELDLLVMTYAILY